MPLWSCESRRTHRDPSILFTTGNRTRQTLVFLHGGWGMGVSVRPADQSI